MGNAAGLSADQVGDLAGAIAAKTGVDDEAIQSGENLLLTFGNIKDAAGEGNDIFSQTTKLMVDMSAAMGTDASGSAIQLGKALNDPIKGITALTRVGVSFTEAQKDQIRALTESGDIMGAQKIILGELERQFGGAAEAMATPMDKVKVAVGNVAEQMGGYLLPAVSTVADGLLALIDGFEGGSEEAGGFLGVMQDVGGGLHLAFDALGEIVGVIGDIAGFFADLPGPVQLGIGAFVAFTALKGPVSDLFETIALKALYATEAIGTAAAGGLRGAASGLVGFLGGPWGIAIAGATVGLGFLVSALMDSDDAQGENAEQAQRAAAAQQSFADAVREANGAITENVRESAAKAAQDAGLLDAVEGTAASTSEVTDALLGNADAYENVRGAIERHITSLRLQASGTGEAAEAARGQIAESERQLGVLDSLVQTMPESIASQQQLTEAVQGSADTTATYTAGLQDAVDAAKDAQDQTNLLKSALDALTGANVSVDQATASYYSALRDAQAGLGDVTGAVVAYNGYLDLSTEAGSAAADQLIDLAEQSHGYMAALQTQGATQEEVAALDSQLRDAFYQTALQMSGNEESARLLTERYYGIPEDIATVVTADTSQAESQINALLVNYRGRQITVGAGFSGTLGTLAFGGPVPGWSPHKRADNIPIMATAGEYMQNVDAVDYYGVGFMEALNRRQIPRDQLQYLANGGLVDGIQLKVAADTSNLARQLAAATSGGTPGGGSVGGGWTSIWNWIKARVPQARVNSTFRAGDPGYHGRGKAVDLGFGSGPGGNGSAGLALINRTLFDGLGGNLAELIYDGIGDDRADIKNGRPHTYNAGTRAEHHNHVHAAVYGDGTNYVPQDGYAYLHQGETVIPAASQGAPFSGLEITGTLAIGGDGLARIVDGRIVTALTGATQRRRYNG